MNKKAVAEELVKIAKMLSAHPFEREEYPEGLYQEVNIKMTFNPDTGSYSISCPEWRYEGPVGRSPSSAVGSLVREIVKHNQDEMTANI